jgi:hypothetical protein
MLAAMSATARKPPPHPYLNTIGAENLRVTNAGVLSPKHSSCLHERKRFGLLKSRFLVYIHSCPHQLADEMKQCERKKACQGIGEELQQHTHTQRERGSWSREREPREGWEGRGYAGM